MKTKALVTAQLICVFVFAYAKRRFYHNEAQKNELKKDRMIEVEKEIEIII